MTALIFAAILGDVNVPDPAWDKASPVLREYVTRLAHDAGHYHPAIEIVGGGRFDGTLWVFRRRVAGDPLPYPIDSSGPRIHRPAIIE